MNFQILAIIALGFSVFTILMMVWIILNLRRLDRLRHEFYKNDSDKNLEQVLVEQNQTITKLAGELTDTAAQLKDLRVINQSDFKKIGFVRFNPFDDAGGNISFAIALLNAYNDGVVISSLHGREGTRMYAKSVKSGQSESQLTKEETDAIAQAK